MASPSVPQKSQPRIRTYAADSVKADGDGYTWTISTGSVDRDRDTLAVAGWDLADFRKNPVVLWSHDRNIPPIGKAESILVSGGALKSRMVFAEKGSYPLADTVRALVDQGIVRATSVGFLPQEWEFNDKRGGYDFTRQALLEFSLVSIPSNPEALADAKASGVDLEPVRTWAVKVLDAYEPGSWMAKANLETMALALAAPKVAGFDPEPFLAEFTKRGRTLSAANEARIREARDAGAAIGVALDDVLAQVQEVLEEPKAAEIPVMPFVLVRPEPTFSVDPDVVKAVMTAAISSVVTERINTARGRID